MSKQDADGSVDIGTAIGSSCRHWTVGTIIVAIVILAGIGILIIIKTH